jgi:hypothetical protein
MESPLPRTPQWIRYFIEKKAINREEIDRSFSRLHWIMTDETVSDSFSSIELYKRSSSAELGRWFNSFAFYNRVAKPVSIERAGARPAQLAAARQIFGEALDIIKPKGVWVIGKAQCDETLPILDGYRIAREIMIPHVAFISNLDGKASWRRFRSIMRGSFAKAAQWTCRCGRRMSS